MAGAEDGTRAGAGHMVYVMLALARGGVLAAHGAIGVGGDRLGADAFLSNSGVDGGVPGEG